MARDQSPALPATVSLSLRGYACGSADYSGVPETYALTSTLADSTLDLTAEGYPGPLGLTDTCLAVFTANGAATPTNQTSLQSLSDQIAADLWAWRSVAFDVAYAGIAAPVLDGSIDEAIWTYRADECSTRLISAPWDSHSEQGNHSDPANTCANCVPIYDPAASSSGTITTIPKAFLCLENGELVEKPNGSSIFGSCCEAGTTTLCVTVLGCYDGYGGNAAVAGTVTITDPSGAVHSGTVNSDLSRYCIATTLSGTYSVAVTGTGYFELDFTYDLTITSGMPEVGLTAYLTPTSIPCYIGGCFGALPGATITFSGGTTGTCTTGSDGRCTIELSGAIVAGASTTTTITRTRYNTYTATVTAPSGPTTFGGTLGCSLFINPLYALPEYACCPGCADPYCKTLTMSTPFGSCTVVTNDSFGIVECSFTKTVTAWPYIETTTTPVDYFGTCGVYGYSPGSYAVTFHVEMYGCTNGLPASVTVRYQCCGFGDFAGVALQDTPTGTNYVSAPQCTNRGLAAEPQCPSGGIVGQASISGTLYCDGTYTLTEDCTDMLRRPRGGPSQLFDGSALARKPEAVAANPPGVPATFPPPIPPDGRVRVGVVSPCCYLGGAERWISELLDWCNGSRLRWDGVAILNSPNIPTIPTVVADWREHCPVASGESAIRELASRVDLLLSWGVTSSWLERLINRDLPVVEVSHCAFETPEAQAMCAMPQSKVVAVAHPALKGIPPARRADATIIHNGVNPARVVPKLSAVDQKAAWGIRPHTRVVGWISRISEEKRPNVFIDAIPRLPSEWWGVLVGAGLGTDAAKAHAARACPSGLVFAGSTDDVGSALGAFECMVMTTRSEGCCQAIAEAWLAGVPVISTKVGLLEEHPELARLIPNPPTGADVADAILADHHDTEGTATRVALAQSFAAEHLSAERFGRDWTEFLCSLVPKPEPPGFFSKAVAFAGAMIDHAADGFRKAPPEIQAERRSLCLACPKQSKNADACTACGCGVSGALSFVGLDMNVKRAMASSRCPLPQPKWNAV